MKRKFSTIFWRKIFLVFAFEESWEGILNFWWDVVLGFDFLIFNALLRLSGRISGTV